MLNSAILHLTPIICMTHTFLSGIDELFFHIYHCDILLQFNGINLIGNCRV